MTFFLPQTYADKGGLLFCPEDFSGQNQPSLARVRHLFGSIFWQWKVSGARRAGRWHSGRSPLCRLRGSAAKSLYHLLRVMVLAVK